MQSSNLDASSCAHVTVHIKKKKKWRGCAVWLTHCLYLWVDFASHHRSAQATLSDSGSALPALGSGQTQLGTRSSSTWEEARQGGRWEEWGWESVELSKAWNRSPCYMKTMSALGGLATAIFSELQCFKGASNWTSFIYRSANKSDSWRDSRTYLTRWQIWEQQPAEQFWDLLCCYGKSPFCQCNSIQERCEKWTCDSAKHFSRWQRRHMTNCAQCKKTWHPREVNYAFQSVMMFWGWSMGCGLNSKYSCSGYLLIVIISSVIAMLILKIPVNTFNFSYILSLWVFL